MGRGAWGTCRGSWGRRLLKNDKRRSRSSPRELERVAPYRPKISSSPLVANAIPVSECNALVRVYRRACVP